AKYTGTQKSGIITWNNTLAKWNRHVMHDRFPGGAVVFSMGGELSHTVHVTGYNDQGTGSSRSDDVVSEKIANSHDADPT
nr:hypothetical protein [Fimbriimonadaceae bacterium]